LPPLYLWVYAMTYQPKHTSVEYLAWINRELSFLGEVTPKGYGLQNENYRASLLANRDVLVRHKETEPLSWLCGGCARYREGDLVSKWPCKTYLDIAQRLDEVM